MNIVIIGSGNTAAVLGRKFIKAGHRIVQVVSRNPSAASELAYEWDTESVNYQTVINRQADVYLVAVSDNAIKEVIGDLQFPGKVVAHTAASVPADVLANVSEHYGVFYPLQSLNKERKVLPDIPVFFEGNDERAKTVLKSLAHSIAFDQVLPASGDERVKLHLAAVVVNNFTNYLYRLAQDYCRREGIDFGQLIPLIRETGDRLQELPAAKVQTGPAIRHDTQTIQKHLALLQQHPELQRVYSFLSDSIEGKGEQ
ncbi:DUF2520 domain-containing protein [Nostoc ellipsosporum NOK]|jgi:predicted short-subunit dehydrogenase-like oxidoreductase (DUF2520 family)|nr:DUF2520 domain-containing protein [Nostoc ellipsosporum NOK]